MTPRRARDEIAQRTGADAFDDFLGRTKPAKGERATVVRYLEAHEVVHLREPVALVGESDGRVLLEGGVIIILVTDRKVIAARTSGGFRPDWEAFTLPFGHLEPGVKADGSQVCIPTSGRRSYRVILGAPDSAAQLATVLGNALGAYRRDRMGLPDL